MKEWFIEIGGWYGMTAVVTAYILVSFEIIEPGFLYQLLNITGSLGLIIVSFHKRAYQPGVLNIIWIAVAIGALINLMR
jgi:4-hydroxybenzoate polyprenyltransferase